MSSLTLLNLGAIYHVFLLSYPVSLKWSLRSAHTVTQMVGVPTRAENVSTLVSNQHILRILLPHESTLMNLKYIFCIQVVKMHAKLLEWPLKHKNRWSHPIQRWCTSRSSASRERRSPPAAWTDRGPRWRARSSWTWRSNGRKPSLLYSPPAGGEHRERDDRWHTGFHLFISDSRGAAV